MSTLYENASLHLFSFFTVIIALRFGKERKEISRKLVPQLHPDVAMTTASCRHQAVSGVSFSASPSCFASLIIPPHSHSSPFSSHSNLCPQPSPLMPLPAISCHSPPNPHLLLSLPPPSCLLSIIIFSHPVSPPPSILLLIPPPISFSVNNSTESAHL